MKPGNQELEVSFQYMDERRGVAGEDTRYDAAFHSGLPSILDVMVDFELF